MRRRKVMAVLLTAGAVMVGLAPALAQEEDRVVMTVGVTQPPDSLNITVGALVIDFEVWNLQYATLTDKAAADFSIEPSLAQSWVVSDGGLTYTYTLREGLLWSDGTPLTAEDVAWTVNTSRDQEWFNHSAISANLAAEPIDDRTVKITSSVPDPKLPIMDLYILPKHIWEPQAAGDVTAYDGEDGVGSGPFVLAEYVPDQVIRMVANQNYWKGRPAIDEVVFQIFTNDDTMVAALKAGEIDAAHDVPSDQFAALDADPDIVAVAGHQGGFEELALNAGAGLAQPHPSLLDLRVRQAINHAIDKQAIVEEVFAGIGEPGTTISPSADPKWRPEIPAGERFEFDLDKANQILDDAGYADTDGDGIREMPGGGNPLIYRYGILSESQTAAPMAEFVSGWLGEIGIGTEISTYDSGQLIEVIGKGEYEIFTWGWTPFVDPDILLWYFISDNLSTDPDDPSNYWNDANWSNPRFDELYTLQNQELDPEQRLAYVHEMLRIFYDDASYIVLLYNPDLQAYRTDRFEGFVQQPAGSGPVLFSNTSPSYFLLTPVDAGGGAGGVNGVAIGVGVGVGVALLAALAWSRSRRKPAEDRE